MIFNIFKKTHILKNQGISSLYSKALNEILNSNNSEALSILYNIVKQDSKHVHAYIQIGNILRENNPEQALKIHKTLTVRKSLDKQSKIDIAQALSIDYNYLNQLDSSIIEAEKVLKFDKKNIWALKYLIFLNEKNHNWELSIDYFKRLKKEIDTDEDDYNRLMVFKFLKDAEKQDNKIVIRNLNNIKLRSPNFAMVYKHLGYLYAKERDLINAIEMWERFSELEPDNAQCIFSEIEKAFFDLGRYSEVEKFYKNILKNVINIKAVLRLSNLLDEKGEKQSAINLVDKYLGKGEDLSLSLMKLKLATSVSTPVELGLQIDSIIKSISSQTE